jgi:hypothetical protein
MNIPAVVLASLAFITIVFQEKSVSTTPVFETLVAPEEASDALASRDKTLSSKLLPDS